MVSWKICYRGTIKTAAKATGTVSYNTISYFGNKHVFLPSNNLTPNI
jgi:hypothetical protein